MHIKPKIISLDKKVYFKFEVKNCDESKIEIVAKVNKKEVFNRLICLDTFEAYLVNEKINYNDVVWFYYKKSNDLVYINKITFGLSSIIMDMSTFSRQFFLDGKNKMFKQILEVISND